MLLAAKLLKPNETTSQVVVLNYKAVAATNLINLRGKTYVYEMLSPRYMETQKGVKTDYWR